MQHPNVLAFWSGPRNVSTALMYSFAQRTDCHVMDEPLFGHFLKFTGVARPSRKEVLQMMPTDAEAILKSFSAPSEQPFVMLKNMANHLEGLDFNILQDFKNVILTRHPAKVIHSYTKNVAQPTELDLCYFHQSKIVQFLKEKQQPFYILDSDDLIENPEEKLREVCVFLEIPFDEKMLRWEAGPRSEDGVWAKYWYENVHRSTGFSQPKKDKEYPIPGHLKMLYETSLNYYKKLNQK